MKKYFFLIIIGIISLYFPIKQVLAQDITLDYAKTLENGTTSSYYVKNTGIITFNNQYESTDEFELFKILDYYYNATTKNFEYDFTDNFKAFLQASDDIKVQDLTVDKYKELIKAVKGQNTDETQVVTDSLFLNKELNKLLTEYARYMKKNNLDGIIIQLAKATNTSVIVGDYAVIPTKSNVIYEPTICYFEMVSENMNYEGKGVVTLNYSVEPYVEKMVNDLSKVSVGKGEIFTYTNKFYINNISGEGNYVIHDILPKGIKFVEGNKGGYLVLKDSEQNIIARYDGQFSSTFELKNMANSTIGNVTVEKNSMILTLDSKYINSDVIEMEYRAILDTESNESEIVLGGSGNIAQCNLSYVSSSGENKTTNTATAAVYTYEVKIKNLNTENEGVSSAKFDIYEDDVQSKLETITMNNTGDGQVKFVKEGTYYVKQKIAPKGYQINSDVTEIKVGAISKASNTDGIYTLNFINNVELNLPITGSFQNIIYLIIGGVFIALSVIAMVIYKKNLQNMGS